MCVCACVLGGGTLTPTLTALTTFNNSVVMARPSYFKLGWRNSAHPSPGGMIYKGLKTSWKSAGDKLSGEKYMVFFFFKIPSDFTIKDLKIPLGLVLAEVEAAVLKVQDSMTVFDNHDPPLFAIFRNPQPLAVFIHLSANESFSNITKVELH